MIGSGSSIRRGLKRLRKMRETLKKERALPELGEERFPSCSSGSSLIPGSSNDSSDKSSESGVNAGQTVAKADPPQACSAQLLSPCCARRIRFS